MAELIDILRALIGTHVAVVPEEGKKAVGILRGITDVDGEPSSLLVETRQGDTWVNWRDVARVRQVREGNVT